jgi:hypothetical protein
MGEKPHDFTESVENLCDSKKAQPVQDGPPSWVDMDPKGLQLLPMWAHYSQTIGTGPSPSFSRTNNLANAPPLMKASFS